MMGTADRLEERDGARMAWSFDDDREQHIETESRPTRVLAYAQAAQTLASLGVPVVGYFGSQHHADSGASVGLDLPLVGSGDDVDEDLVKSLDPDLVVTVTYGGEVYGLSAAVADRVAEVAPILAIGIAGDRTLESVIERFHALATALGADVQDPATDLASAPTDPSVRVVALSGGTDTDAYVANPAYWPSLRMLADAGVHFTPTTTAGGWEVVKWDELAAKHPADLVLYDERPNSLGADRLATIPGWSEVPGVQAGNVLPWNPEPPLTYAAADSFVNGLAQR
ncbi:ABC transporter substrate-binding protein [Kribbella jiaozuonensis]|uniref:ABC transporter substrate-binding protein n=2 Tax=Kribbella jiaozuonensis TaxID=2575441 RepID=A0A4U3M4A9_9ACTN|nr:ABC transporter substrate-binding protein [Kribbella jiaozuonensis]